MRPILCAPRIDTAASARHSAWDQTWLGPVIAMLLALVSGALQAQASTDVAELEALTKTIAEHPDADRSNAQMVELGGRKIQLTERIYGPTSEEAAFAYYQLGWAHSGRKEFSQAITAISRAVEIQEKLSPSGDHLVSFYLMHLASAARDQRDWTRAVTALERVIAQKERDEGPMSQQLIDPYFNLSNAFYMLGNSTRAEKHLLHAWAIATEHGWNNSLKSMAHSLHVLGEHYLRTGKAVSAVPLLERELAFLQNSSGVAPEKINTARDALDRARHQAGTQRSEAEANVQKNAVLGRSKEVAQAAGSKMDRDTGKRLSAKECRSLSEILASSSGAVPSKASITASTETVMFRTKLVMEFIDSGCHGVTPGERDKHQQAYASAEQACNAVQSGGRRCTARDHFGNGHGSKAEVGAKSDCAAFKAKALTKMWEMPEGERSGGKNPESYLDARMEIQARNPEVCRIVRGQFEHGINAVRYAHQRYAEYENSSFIQAKRDSGNFQASDLDFHAFAIESAKTGAAMMRVELCSACGPEAVPEETFWELQGPPQSTEADSSNGGSNIGDGSSRKCGRICTAN